MKTYQVLLDTSVVASTYVNVEARNEREAKAAARRYVKEHFNELEWTFPSEVIPGVLDRRDPVVSDIEEYDD